MAWWEIKNRWRWRKIQRRLGESRPLLIGITGSSQVSLTQEAISLVLGEPHHIIFSPPQVLGRRYAAASQLAPILHGQPHVVLLPLAAEYPGDIDWISQQLPFQIAVVTQVGSKNLHEFGSKNMVAHEHTSLVSALADSGHAILNADDELAANMAYHTSAKVVLYGTSSTAQLRLVRSLRLPAGGFAVEIAAERRHYQLSLPYLVAFSQIYSALAALAVAHVLGKDLNEVIPALSELHPPVGELSLTPASAGARILDASSDATPETMLSALHTLRTFQPTLPAEARRRRVAILGDLTDQAGETVGAHKRVGRYSAESAHIFVAVGEHMRHAAGEALLRRPGPPGARLAGGGPDVHHFNTSAEVGEWIQPYLSEGDVILVMGSRNMHMEKVVADLTYAR